MEREGTLTREQMLAYFRDAMEGRAGTERWVDWFARHADGLRALLTPGQHLRLRLGETRETIRAVLDAAGVPHATASGYNAVFHVPGTVPREWLTKRVSVVDVDAEMKRGRNAPLWAFLRSAMEPTDEVWRFSSSARSWQARMGSAGYALVRDGVPYDGVCTLMN